MPNEKEYQAPAPSLEKYMDAISKRAEEIYRARIEANKPGDQISDWFQAENEIKKKLKDFPR